MNLNDTIPGTRIGRVRVIFTLPTVLDNALGPSPLSWTKAPLAYIEWYTTPKTTPEPNHNMYSIRKLYRSDNTQAGSIIPLTSIRQSCMLFPVFSKETDMTWTTDNVLDLCPSFLVNNWQNMYAYKTIW
jgi:hypothetical protein